ncbi:NAD(P)-dependent oxidoreductase [Microbacterium sp. RD1]|uniref:NAD(P)-dependent oxidoreductase n=1 Tax=Microbacterium sp. RD1 TaxID=3457313 RepID=UPI003FA5CF47
MRVIVTDDWEHAALSATEWGDLGSDVSVEAIGEHLDAARLADRLAGADVVVAMRERTRWDAALISRLPDLRLLITTGAANAAIDLAACAAHGITVCGTRSHPGSAAELTWALILAAARRLDRVFPAMAEGWPSSVGTALHGRTLGLLGLGRVGGTVARVGAAFGMEVVAWTPTLNAARAAEYGARAVRRDEVVESAHFLSLHLPLTATTARTVGAADFARMRADAWLVNSSRAGIVDTGALRAALEAGSIAGAALDVFDEEPLGRDSFLRGRSDVILTPHLGYVTDSAFRVWFADVVEDIRAWRGGEPIRVLE